MKDLTVRTVMVLAFVLLLAIVLAVSLYAFGYRPTVGIGS